MIDKKTLTKRYYSISEVAELFDIASSVLRYWESEFTHLSPTKGRNGIRRYTVDDISQIEDIYHLLKERGFTIDGAKKEIKSNKKAAKEDSLTLKLIALKDKLQGLRDILD